MTLSAQEQYMLELINRARLDPLAEAARLNIGLNAGITNPSDLISSAAKQVLAPNDFLDQAAADHSLWQLATDTFSHVGAGGSIAGPTTGQTVTDRMNSAGYTFTPSWAWGENISWQGTTGTLDPTDAIRIQHDSLFISAGHRVNLMKDTFREIGIGQEIGDFTDQGTTYTASMVTQNFATSGSNVFLTGVAYDDADNDDFYSVGEGVANIQYSIGGNSSLTAAAGGFALATAAAAGVSVTVTPQGGSASVVQVDLSAGNVKLDLVDGSLFRTSGNLTLVTGVADAELLGIADLSLTGNGLDNMLRGNNGNNVIVAGNGNDTVYDGVGNDDVDLGDGNDTVVAGGGADTFAGGIGTDRVSYFHSVAGVNVDLLTNAVSGGAAANDVISGFEDIEGSNAANDTLKGNNGDNAIYGNGGSDLVYDRGGNDLVDLGAGNDYVLVGGGIDTLSGGLGTDTISYYYASAGVSIDLLTNAVSGSWAADDVISGFENVVGSNTGGDTISGTQGANVIYAYGGNDLVYGRNGDDRVDLGDGNDFVLAGNGADTLIGGAGIDNVSYYYSTAGVSVDLASNAVAGGWAADDTIVGFESVAGTSLHSDTLKGSNGDNVLRGYAGNDLIFDRAGNDLVDLGDGNDYALAGNGADTFVGGNGTDTISYYYSLAGVRVDLASNALAGGWAADDAISGFERAYGSNTGNDTILGTNGDNLIRTYGGNDTVYDRAGNDIVNLGDGNDMVVVGGGADIIGGGNGIDEISYYYSAAGVSVDLLTNALSGGWAADDVISGFERASGSNTGNDTLSGTNGSNILRGNGGDDDINGRDGVDYLDAGTGNDTLMGGTGADYFIFRPGYQSDTVSDFSLADADTLMIDDAIWGGGLTASEIVTTYALVSGGDVVFDFGGGNVLTLAGLADTSGLDAHITII